MSVTVPTGTKNTVKQEFCKSLGCENAPVGAGYCRECITVSPNVVDDANVGPWIGVQFNNTESDVWLSRANDRQQWMGHINKKPFAPWAGSDHPKADADEDARWKWGISDNYTTCDEVDVDEYDSLDGRVFLQRDEDPFAYVDGDDVRDPETGEVHSAFIEVLDALGLTYADVSQSGCGVHGIYRGELPDGVKQATWQLDSEPFGDNEDLPSIEIYDGKRVCVMTGEHVPETPEYACQWDDEALMTVLNDADQLRNPKGSTTTNDFDPSTWNPDATTATETTDEIQDIFYALDTLDARRVAGQTIVHSWNDAASTSEGMKAFSPIWGPNSNGRANIVDERIWQDTGDEGGYGGPVVMALIDSGELSHKDASPKQATGSLWWQGVEHLRELGFDIPEYGGDALSAVIPAPDGHNNDWNWCGGLTIDSARERTTAAIAEAYRTESRQLIEALPTMGKSFGSVKAAAKTGKPVSILTTRGREEQYEQIAEWCDQHELSSKVLPSVMADCDTFSGEYGKDFKEIVRKWYGNGATGREIHRNAESELGEPLPCDGPAGDRCGFKAGWEFEPDDYDVLIGNYLHANVPSVSYDRTVVMDEFPSDAFEDTLDGSKLSSSVSQFLSDTEALPFNDYTDLIEHRHDSEKRADALSYFDRNEPGRDGEQAFVSNGHALAPLAVFTILAGVGTDVGHDLGNGWERATLPAEFGHIGLFDREENRVHLLMPPSLSEANGLVGLDGTPTPKLWKLALGGGLDHRQVLNDDERNEYLRSVLGLSIIRTTTATKPYSGNPDYVNTEQDHALLEAIAEEHEKKPSLLTTMNALAVYEGSDERVLNAVDESGHYPLEGSNEFGGKRVGAVVGSRHFGDRFIKKWGAYGNEAVERSGKGSDLEYSGIGQDIYRHMVRHQTFQAVMRFGRDANGATVYVHSNTLPEWVPIAGEGRVSTFGDKQQSILQSIMNQDGEFARRDLESPASKRWTSQFLSDMTEEGYLDREKRRGRYYYHIAEDSCPRGLVEFER